MCGNTGLFSSFTRLYPCCKLFQAVKDSLSAIVQHTKAKTVLFGQWDFDSLHRTTPGVSCLFCGTPGSGKTMAAEAIGFDLGRPLKVVNVAELGLLGS